MTSHRNCNHPATKEARRECRKGDVEITPELALNPPDGGEIVTPRYPALTRDSLAAAILTYHTPQDYREKADLVDNLEEFAGGDPVYLASSLLRDMKDCDATPFQVFDPEEVEGKASELLLSEEMRDLLAAAIREWIY